MRMRCCRRPATRRRRSPVFATRGSSVRVQPRSRCRDDPSAMTAAPAPPCPRLRPAGPLAGLRVLDLGNMIAGPFCARVLADFGADVIKVEQPGRGDPARGWRSRYRGHSLLWKTLNRNKRAVTLDLHVEEGQAIARRLYALSDIVVENFRPGVLERWGLGYVHAEDLNPGLIMV